RQSFLHWYYVLIHYMGALFCYLLCRELGCSREASLLGGIVFGLGGYVGTTDWPQMLNGAIWSPLVFLFLVRVMRSANVLANAALAGACLGVAFLSGHHQIPIFITLTSIGFWIYLIFSEAPSRRLVLMGGAALFIAFTIVVSGLQTLPAYECGKLALRWVSA